MKMGKFMDLKKRLQEMPPKKFKELTAQG